MEDRGGWVLMFNRGEMYDIYLYGGRMHGIVCIWPGVIFKQSTLYFL